MKKTIYKLFFLLVTQTIFSQISTTNIPKKEVQIYPLKNGDTLIYKKPKFFDFVVKTPRNVLGTIVDASETKNLIYLTAAITSTFILVNNDQNIILASRKLGDVLNMEKTARYNDFGPLSNIPPNLTSSIYLIGNGTTPILLSIGFATYGVINNDYRSLNTASGLMQSLASSGVFSQTIKRITGRQSPSAAFETGNNGGAWNLFPSFSSYQKSTPNYDAFPSGHLMTASAALFVIAGNYPDVRWIKPVGFTLITVLSFQMAQSYVHWVSDYPIALALGYIIGKNIVKNSFIKKEGRNAIKSKVTYNLDASRIQNSSLVGLKIGF